MKVKINEENNNLYCVYSKEIIAIGEKYAVITDDEGYNFTYKLENIPISEDSYFEE